MAKISIKKKEDTKKIVAPVEVKQEKRKPKVVFKKREHPQTVSQSVEPSNSVVNDIIEFLQHAERLIKPHNVNLYRTILDVTELASFSMSEAVQVNNMSVVLQEKSKNKNVQPVASPETQAKVDSVINKVLKDLKEGK